MGTQELPQSPWLSGGKGSKIAHFPHSAGTAHGAPAWSVKTICRSYERALVGSDRLHAPAIGTSSHASQ